LIDNNSGAAGDAHSMLKASRYRNLFGCVSARTTQMIKAIYNPTIAYTRVNLHHCTILFSYIQLTKILLQFLPNFTPFRACFWMPKENQHICH